MRRLWAVGDVVAAASVLAWPAWSAIGMSWLWAGLGAELRRAGVVTW